jgi:D-sedoheptulose 7-phosphate isomerase
MHPVLETLQKRYPDLQPCIRSIDAAYDLLRETFEAGGKLLVCGNGGSAADSEHIVGELMKGFQRRRPISHQMRERLMEQDAQNGQYIADHLQGALPAIALSSHAALVSAISNDVAADMVFAQQVYGYGGTGDALLAISTSGNSANVLHAMRVAKALGMHVIGLTGRTGGKMNALCDVAICVPYDDTSQIQERHLPVYHTLCVMLEQEFFHD